ncbi:MAG: hypothetical protein ABW328_11355 [Ilumatobacteraceae bacterium]
MRLRATFVLCIAIVGALVGCGGEDASNPPGQTVPGSNTAAPSGSVL